MLSKWNPYSGVSPSFDTNLIFGVKNGFDIVIGNPPYHQLSKDASALGNYKLYLKKRFKTSGGRLNTFIFFIHIGFELLKKNGCFSYIVPNTLLTQDYYKDTRKFLLDNFRLLKVISYDQLPFENVIVENITFLAKKALEDNYIISHYLDTLSTPIKFTGSKRKSEFVDSQTFAFNFRENSITSKIAAINAASLGEICNVNQAIALKGDKNLSIHESNPHNKFYKVLDGRNIGKYHIKWDGKYLDFSLDRIHSCKRKDIFQTTEKLLFRRVAAHLVCCYDNEQFFALNTLIVITAKHPHEYDLKYLLALLNSRLMNYFYVNQYKSTKTVFPEIQARSMAQMPIVRAAKSVQDNLSSLVSSIIEIKKKDSTANVSPLEKAIDQCVYNLYKISDEDIKIIEFGTNTNSQASPKMAINKSISPQDIENIVTTNTTGDDARD